MAQLRPGIVDDIADEVLAALSARKQILPVSERRPEFTLEMANEVNAAVCAKRRARGETPIGRKLGFTNRHIWNEYKVYAPIWSYVYDTTVRMLEDTTANFDLSTVVEPRIEPEITLGLGRTPEPGMDERALLDCLDFVAHGFEVVQSLFPGWRFKAQDTVAAFGLHGALLLGPKILVNASNRSAWFDRLTRFEVSLFRNEQLVDRGEARNVLGGPLSALKHSITVLSSDAHNPQISAGEFVTTGTITRAFPMNAGETWRSSFAGAPFPSLIVHLT